VIQDIDCVNPEFEVRGSVTADLESLDHVHVEIERSGTFDRCQAHRTHFTRLRIDQHDLPIGSHNRLVTVGRIQAVQRCNARQSGIRDLGESIEVDDAVGNFRDVAHIARQRADDVRLGLDVTDGLRAGRRASDRSARREAERRSGVEVHDAAELPLVDDLLNPAGSVA